MCSNYFLKKRMENYRGDLADIIRSAGPNAASSADLEWQLPSNPIVGYDSFPSEDFGDPFNSLRDPLLHDIDTPIDGFFQGSNIVIGCAEDGTERFVADNNGSINRNLAQKIMDDEMKRPSNIFSRMLQISPNAKLPISPCDSPAMASTKGLKVPPMLASDDHALISPKNSKGCFLESPVGLQISSPRNTGIKRRKSQAKKVVCIPAPAPANSRATGEVVPSDLWAWRKYGQKPIKGSPYPRGYYRCSSSKGCSARKQVERSRTDPNMLVITYTSEHNHPWPTQRNALAGSTRSQPTKTSSKNSPISQQQQKSSNPKEGHNDTSQENTAPSSTESPPTVKEEMEPEMEDHTEFIDGGFPHSYKPIMPEDSFFSELGEIESDPDLHLLFAQGFSGTEDARENKSLDPFSFYDWAGTNSSSGATTSYGEAKKDSLS